MVYWVVMLECKLLKFFFEWVSVTMTWCVLRLWFEKQPSLCILAANVLNKQSQPTRGGPPAWGLGKVVFDLF
jgi:hypothetical protein